MNKLIDVQLAASVWSLRQVLEPCRGLSEEQFNRPLDIGPPPHTLQSTLAHTIGAMFFFADNFDRKKFTPPPTFNARKTSIEGLRSLLDEAELALRSALDRFLQASGGDLDAPVFWPFGNTTISAAQALAQVFDHTTHHRVQCLHMLKKLGVSALPEAYPLRGPGPEVTRPA